MKKLSKAHRKAAWVFLRAAQAERFNYTAEEFDLDQRLEARAQMLKFFIVPITPAIYAMGARPMMLGSARIGITLKFERAKGNKCRVYYSSDAPMALECVKVDNQWLERDLWKYFGQDPLLQTIYHMRIQKSVVTAPRPEMVNSGG